MKREKLRETLSPPLELRDSGGVFSARNVMSLDGKSLSSF